MLDRRVAKLFYDLKYDELNLVTVVFVSIVSLDLKNAP